MLKRVDKVFVNKTGVRPHNLAASTTLAVGEVAVVDAKFVKITGAATDDTVYVVRNMGTAAITLPLDGTDVSTKELFISSPIKKGTVRSAKYIRFSPIINQIKTLSLGATGNATANAIYTLTLVYKDTKGFLQKRQNKQSFEYLAPATAPTLATVASALATSINADTNARITATASTVSGEEYIKLTAKDVKANFGLNDIDEYTQVIFEAVLTKTSPKTAGGYDFPVKFGTDVTTTGYKNAPLLGSGDWKLVRDMEKFAKSYRGLTNRTWFPIPEFNTEWTTEMVNQLVNVSSVTLTNNDAVSAIDMTASLNFDNAFGSVIPSTTGNIFTGGMVVYASGFLAGNGWHTIKAAATAASVSLYRTLSLATAATGTLTFYPGYEMIVIEHDTYYESPDNQQSRTAALTEILCFPNVPITNAAVTNANLQMSDVATMAGHIATALGCTVTIPTLAEIAV